MEVILLPIQRMIDLYFPMLYKKQKKEKYSENHMKNRYYDSSELYLDQKNAKYYLEMLASSQV